MGSWIAVDWGTSRLKAWHVAEDGRVLAETATSAGAGRLRGDAFEAALVEAVGGWLDEDPIDVLVAGMAGRRGGWRQAPYLDLPGDLDGLATHCVAVPCADARLKVAIVPGLCQRRPRPDVMRGEETQLQGLLAREPGFAGRVCLPGTHSKWAEVGPGGIVGFRTFMTGEVFALIAAHSILANDVAADDAEGFDPAAFEAGLRRGAEAPGDLIASMFEVRAAGLLSAADPGGARARLSGLLIGAELGAAGATNGDPVVIIGAKGLAARYVDGVAMLGGRARRLDVEAATLAGLEAIRSKRRAGRGGAA